MTVKVYISGPISGLEEEEFKTNFGRAEALLLDLGHEPVSPLKVLACADEVCGSTRTFSDGSYQHTWKCYMKYDILALLECDAIAFLPGYLGSRGAALEGSVARGLDYPAALVEIDYKSIIMTSGEGWG